MTSESLILGASIADGVGIAPDVLEVSVPREVGLLIDSDRYVVGPDNVACALE
jgi:hypothetical protein